LEQVDQLPEGHCPLRLEAGAVTSRPKNAAMNEPKQLLVAIATIDFAFLKQNQCCFELQE
jgi:hypothetical protein